MKVNTRKEEEGRGKEGKSRAGDGEISWREEE